MKESIIHNCPKISYLKEKLAGATKVTPYRSNVAFNSASFEPVTLEIPVANLLSEKLIAISKGKDINLYKLFLAGLSITLWKYTIFEEITVTTSSFNLKELTFSDVSSLLFFRLGFNEENTIKELLGQVHSELTENISHQDYDYYKFRKELASSSEGLSAYKGIGLYYEGLNSWINELEQVTVLFKIGRIAKGLYLTLDFNSSLYSTDEMSLFGNHILKATELLTADFSAKIKDVNPITPTDESLILNSFNKTDKAYDRTPVIDQFEAQVLKNPNRIAAKSGDTALTYAVLNNKANSLAHYLIEECKVQPHDRVALMVNRSENVLIGILAILKAGAVFMPVDITSPEDRISFQLKDGGCKAVITESSYIAENKTQRGPLLVSVTDNYLEKNENPGYQLGPEDVAYIVYTSGTTGRPKGALIANYSLSNNVFWFKTVFELTKSDSTMLINSYNFDGCYGFLWATIVTGGTLHIPRDVIFDPDATLRYIKKEQLTFLKLVPSTFAILVNSTTFEEDNTCCKSIRMLQQGGEKINPKHLRKYLETYPTAKLGNHYGPTECTIGAVAHWITLDTINEFSNQPVLGSPYNNQQTYILNERQELLPVGMLGEVYISGEGVSKGYLNNEALTQQKFMLCPFKKDKIMYRTGDKARWLPDGTIEFLGRIDNQVKIRGYRVELDEISESIKEFDSVRDAITLLYTNEQQEYLALWFTAEDSVSRKELEDFLALKLPDYMLPDHYVQIEHIPLTLNGKIDKQQLPDPLVFQLLDERSLIAPSNDTEAAILEIWKQLLGTPEISTDDNFFQIGGHSLKATQMLARIHKKFEIKIPLTEVFMKPTILELSTYLLENIEKKEAFVEIEKAPEQDYYPLSHAQKRMWLTNQIQVDKTVYNIPHAIRIQSEIDKSIIEKSLQLLIGRHESLRTVFPLINGEPCQKVIPSGAITFKLLFEDLQQYPNPEVIALEIAEKEGGIVFDLENKPALSARLLQLATKEYVFLFTLHHIISDGSSTQVFTEELIQNYLALQKEDDSMLPPPLKIQYKDFTLWQQNEFEKDSNKKLKEYWQQKFAGEITDLELPVDYNRSLERTYEGGQKAIEFDPEMHRALTELGNNEGVTMFMICMTFVKILLYRYTGQKDIIVGTPVAGREHADLANQIGFYVNTLAIRSNIYAEKGFIENLKEIKNNLIEAYEHQSYPFDQLLDDIGVKAENGRAPLFDVMVVMQNEQEKEAQRDVESGLVVSDFDSGNQTSKYDLTFSFREDNSSLSMVVEYSKELFTESKIDRLLIHFQNLIKSTIKSPNKKISKINYLSEKEATIISKFNGDPANDTKYESITERFTTQVNLFGDKTALVDAHKKYTYKELHDKALKHALHLRKSGIKPGEVIGLIGYRNADFVVNMLAILKAGAVYLPLEENMPVDRMKRLLEITNAVAIISQANESINNLGIEVKCILTSSFYFEKTRSSESIPDILETNTAESLAYIMFTSGTTGNPKGVMVQHKNVVRLIKSPNYTSLSCKDKILQTGSLSFDAATFEIWGALLNGGQIYLTTLNELLDINLLRQHMEQKEISRMWFTSSWFNQLADLDPSLFKSLRQVLVGGEKLSSAHIKKVKDACPDLQITNGYGPTENTTFSICGDVLNEDLDQIKLGYPITGSTVHILDANLMPVPVGITGELYLGGAGVSKGYINDKVLTQQKFVRSPFNADEIFYKSGDLGRWCEDGRVLFYGRTDEQVKIRGHRIEPAEIQNAMLDHSSIKEAAVFIIENDKKEKAVAAYYTISQNLKAAEIKEYLKEKLPGYMIPEYFTALESMPLNKNGKVDRKSLPKPDFTKQKTALFVDPNTTIEKRLRDCFATILNMESEKISIIESFFDLGGHSLKALRLAGLIEQEFKVRLNISKIFLKPTVKALAAMIEVSETFNRPALSKAPAHLDIYPVTAVQHRLFTIFHLNPESLAYNVPGMLEIPLKYSVQDIKQACAKLVERHEILRTSFLMRDQEVFQKVNPVNEIEVAFIETKDPENALEKFVRPFDLEQAPLLRVGLIKNEKAYGLLMDFHHIVVDGLSQTVLIEELFQLLANITPEPIPLQYKDFAWWLNQVPQKDNLNQQEAYWLERYASPLPKLELPADYTRPAVTNYKGGTAQFVISDGNKEFLRNLSKEQGTTLYMNLMAVWALLLSKMSGVEDLAVGTPVSGRTLPELSRMVGMFVNTLAIRVFPKTELSFLKFLKTVKTHILRDFEHQEYPLEDLIEKAGFERVTSENPVFNTMFSLLTKEEFSLEIDTTEKEPVFNEKLTGVKFDLNFKVADLDDKIVCNLDYNSDLFSEGTIRSLVNRFNMLLDKIKLQPETAIKSLSLLSDQEKNCIAKVNSTSIKSAVALKTVDQLFDEKAIKYPEKIGFADSKGSLSLKQIKNNAAKVANAIIEKREVVKNISFVGIMLPASKEIAIAILGIFKAGAAYVPIDTDLPSERIKHILEDSEVALLISTKEVANSLNFSGQLLDIDEIMGSESLSNEFVSQNYPENTAYMIYTSGSTGKPKGVPIKQYQLVNYIDWFTNKLNYTHEDSSLLVSSYAYDLGHSSIFPAIANGGALHILKKEEYLSTEFLGNYIQENEISYVKMTPTLFNVFINDANYKKNYMSSIKQLMIGGEAIIVKDVEKFFEYYPDQRFINHYGPTETTIGCVAKVLTLKEWKTFKEQPVIGSPINNMQVYILDTRLNQVPAGAIGQIYLSGKGVSTGYHNRPDLTKEKFIDNPFKKGEKMYATGDLGCWNSNYEVVFKGRVDHQVKIRGYRVELDEIAAVLRGVDEVANAAVITLGELDDIIIAAYVETSKEVTLLYEVLENLLPAYMIPSVIIPIAEIPMTPNGKTDINSLKAIPVPDQFTQGAVAPANEREEQLVKLWESILKVPVRDTGTDFFKLGGHSLKALKVVNYIEQNWHLKVPLKTFFENPTVKGLAEKLNDLKYSKYIAINPVAIQENYPLSHAQQRLWLLNELSENQVAYNIPRVFKLRGTVNKSVMRQVFDAIVERHEVLRTVFSQVAGIPRQAIIPAQNFTGYFTVEEITHLSEEKVKSRISDLVNYTFDLEKGPLIKVALLKQSSDTYLLVVNLHHIISDGWSAAILLQELCEGYNNLVTDKPILKEALPIQYKDFAVWQNRRLADPEYLENQRNYWRTKLSGELQRCTLPESFSRSSNQKTEGKTLTHVMSDNIAGKLEQLAIEQQSSLYMVLLSALNVLLYRYTGQKDIIMGTVIAGREREELSNQIGFYVNTIAQRTQLNPKDSFIDVLKGVKDDILAATEYQYYPFDLVVSDLELVKEGGRSPLFDIMFVHQNNEDAEDYELTLEGLTVEEVGEDLNESKFDVSFVTRIINNDLQVFVEYNSKIYSEVFLKGFLTNFENLLNTLTIQKRQQIGKVTYLSDSYLDSLAAYNTTFKHKIYTNIQSHFEKSALQASENIAVITPNGSLSYKTLNEKANQMAWWIRDTYGIQQNRLIAFCLERSEWQLISMLAILKSGAGFLPIDTKQPTKRKDFILNDANPVFLIIDESNHQSINDVTAETIATIDKKSSSYPKNNPEHVNKAEDLAYTIYTSGSTGTPKGVMIPHRGNINMVTDQVKRFQITPKDRCLQFASVSFDASVYEIFIGLYAGSAIVLLTNEIIEDPKIFIKYINEKKVTFATLPPVYLSTLDKKALTNLKVLVTAGESPNSKDAQYLCKHLNYFNAYGPTEYSVCASVYKVQGDEDVIPIGAPLENTSMYILDDTMNLLPTGCWGELYLSGAGMAIGYINRPDENDKRFLNNPFNKEFKLYRTGDIARWNAKGCIEFKGRRDNMLKIRGYRIEAAEIEQAILECDQINEAIIHFEKGRQLLIAYLIANDHISEVEIKSFLKERIPGYMIPSICCFLENIPLTTNGKVDYNALSNLTKHSIDSREITLPENEMEKTVRNLWAELLNKDENLISTHDNFFDLGGNSILAMKLTTKIWEIYNKDISIRDFLKNPSIKGLVHQLTLREKDKGLLVSLNKVQKMEKELFMIPPVLGSSSVFRNLALHFEKHNVACYGVQYRGFDYEDSFDESIEQMAFTVIDEIRNFLSLDKHLFITGYSMGALIAAEVTAKLEEEGFKVSLIVIDKMLEDSMGELHETNYDENSTALQDLLLKQHTQGFEIPDHNLSRIKNLLKHNIRLLNNYTFTKYLKADILAVEAKESNRNGKMKSWKKVTDGTIFYSELEGNHFTVINEVNSYELYRNINRFINNNTN
jgi:tyrocidine synthetase-3